MVGSKVVICIEQKIKKPSKPLIYWAYISIAALH